MTIEGCPDESSMTKLSKVDELFAGLVVEVTKFELQQLKIALDNLSTHRPWVPVYEKFFTNDMSDVLEATSVLNLIFALMSYWSFINFQLLQYIIEFNPALKTKMDDYINLLSEIKISELPLLLHPDCKVNRFSDDPVILQMEVNFMHEGRVKNLLNILAAVLNVLNLEHQSILLKSIDKNKHEIHLLIVANATNSLIDGIPNSSSILLKEQKVAQVFFKGRKILTLTDEEIDVLKRIPGNYHLHVQSSSVYFYFS